MTKTAITSPPATTSASYLDSDKPAKVRRARRMAREPDTDSSAGAPAPAEEAAALPARGPTKIAAVLEQLRRPDGATLDELVEVTGWQPHTTRAALTGLRKKGHVLAKDKRGDVTCYRIAEAG